MDKYILVIYIIFTNSSPPKIKNNYIILLYYIILYYFYLLNNYNMMKSISREKLSKIIFISLIILSFPIYNLLFAADIATDFTSPIFDKVVISTSNSWLTEGTWWYVKTWDSIFLDLYIVDPDSMSNLSYIEFSVWSNTGLIARSLNYQGALTTMTRNEYILPSNIDLEWEINLTRFSYYDNNWNDLTWTTLTHTGLTSIFTDNIPPDISLTNDLETVTADDIIHISMLENNLYTPLSTFIFSDDNICSNKDYSTWFNFVPNTDITLDYMNYKIYNWKYMCVQAMDKAWNKSIISSINKLFLLFDTDWDKVPNDVEIIDWTDPNDINSFLDNDLDLVPNYIENIELTNINNKFDFKDLDIDFIPDYIELLQWTNINDKFSFFDTDWDHVADYIEIIEWTDKNNINSFLDTDWDLVPDFYEKVVDGSDWLDPLNIYDDDGDWVPDYIEIFQWTDVLIKYSFLDTDNDWVPDYVETREWTNPTDNTSILDTDLDWVPNFIEISQWTDPYSIISLLDTDWDLLSDYVDPNDDWDNMNDIVENAAPNWWDANEDWILDSAQWNVSSLVSSITNEYVTLDTIYSTNNCIVPTYSILDETNLNVKDQLVDYPAWLNKFTVNCSQTWATATVSVYYYWIYNTSEWTYKKYNSNTHIYTDMSSIVSYDETSIWWKNVSIVSYDLTDWWIYDEDWIANWVIVDPSGPSILWTTVWENVCWEWLWDLVIINNDDDHEKKNEKNKKLKIFNKEINEITENFEKKLKRKNSWKWDIDNSEIIALINNKKLVCNNKNWLDNNVPLELKEEILELIHDISVYNWDNKDQIIINIYSSLEELREKTNYDYLINIINYFEMKLSFEYNN